MLTSLWNLCCFVIFISYTYPCKNWSTPKRLKTEFDRWNWYPVNCFWSQISSFFFFFAFIVTGQCWDDRKRSGRMRGGPRAGIRTWDARISYILTNINHYFFRDTNRKFINDVYGIHCCHFYITFFYVNAPDRCDVCIFAASLTWHSTLKKSTSIDLLTYRYL